MCLFSTLYLSDRVRLRNCLQFLVGGVLGSRPHCMALIEPRLFTLPKQARHSTHFTTVPTEGVIGVNARKPMARRCLARAQGVRGPSLQLEVSDVS